MRDLGWMLGFSIRHHATESEMDDLLYQEMLRNPAGLEGLYHSWKGVQSALARVSGILSERFPCCLFRHQALEVRADHTVIPCAHPGCASANRRVFFDTYEYVHLWPQLECRLQSKKCGPLLYNYYREGLRNSGLDKRNGLYRDFFSGSNFQAVQSMLGGREKIENDIFVFLSTDGVSPFKSTQYSCWPVVMFIANLPPSERFKMENVIPVMVVPGKSSPKDLNSFLQPALDELSSLSEYGVCVRIWDGTEMHVRVHLLFSLLDLMAVAKICLLSGPNGRVPCRFCLISGIYDETCRHISFPSTVQEQKTGKARKKRRIIRRLWSPETLPRRTHDKVRDTYRRIEVLNQSNRRGEANDIRAKNGFSRMYSSPFFELPTMFAFSSFPIDIMHLLYENIAPFVVSLWTSADEDIHDIAVLSDISVLRGVERSLSLAGYGISPTDSARRPRALRYRNSWKASEWKTFVLTTSTAVLHEWIPERYLQGWWLFVQLCDILSQWQLSEALIVRIENISKDFFDHFMTAYYQLMPSRVKLCRYTMHLLLHFAENVRNCGPLSMLAQWSMETFVGVMKVRCNARSRFAESVAENVKREASARMYSVRRGMDIPYLDTQEPDAFSPALRVSSPLSAYDGYFFRHPRQIHRMETLETDHFPGLRKMMTKHYELLYDLTRQEAETLVTLDDELSLWDRLEDEKAANSCPVIYRRSEGTEYEDDEGHRRSCYFAGVFRYPGHTNLEVCYGKAIAFIEHFVNGGRNMLVLASWVSRGLHVGEQGQVFSKRAAASSALFSTTTVEAVNCISHPISALQTLVPNRVGRLSARTYFVDELREKYGLLNGTPWDERHPRMTLRGVSGRT